MLKKHFSVDKLSNRLTPKIVKRNLPNSETKANLITNTLFDSNGSDTLDNLTTNNYKVSPSLSLPSHIGL